MSFQPPNARQELQNRKILEELQAQKKMLQKQAQPGNTTGAPAMVATAPHAHTHSVGYFITQDSSFGNLILPVIPRLENK